MLITHRCSIRNCESPVIARDLCRKHYKRWQRHQDPLRGPPTDWGVKENHPLGGLFSHIRRTRKDSLDPRWRSSFTQFIKDVGERPENGRLRPVDPELPLGPENFYWKIIIPWSPHPEERKKRMRESARRQRELNSEETKDKDLLRTYGVSLGWYQEVSESQNHNCAICGNPETLRIRGKLVRLAVDHKPGTRHVRGLLCSKCNRGLGLFCDNPEILKLAAKYLQNHEKRLRKLSSE